MNNNIRQWKGQAVISIKQLTELWNIEALQIKMAVKGCTDGDYFLVTRKDNYELKAANFTTVSRNSNGYTIFTRQGALHLADILGLGEQAIKKIQDYFGPATPVVTSKVGVDASFLLRGETIIYNNIMYPTTSRYMNKVAVTHETAAEMFGVTPDMVANELSMLVENKDYFVIQDDIGKKYAEQHGYEFSTKQFPYYMITSEGLIKLAASFKSSTSWDIMLGALELFAAGFYKKEHHETSLTDLLNAHTSKIIEHIDRLADRTPRDRRAVTKIRDHVWQDNNGTYYIDQNWVTLPHLHRIDDVAHDMGAYSTLSLRTAKEPRLHVDAVKDFVCYVLGCSTTKELLQHELVTVVFQSHNISNGDLVRDGVPEPRLTDEGFDVVRQYWQEHRDEFILADNTMDMWPGHKRNWSVTFL